MTRPRTRRSTFQLTPALVAAHAGSLVTCLSTSAIGQSFRLFAARPGASLNRPIYAGATTVDPFGGVSGDGDEDVGDFSDGAPVALTRVDISGVIEQRAGYHDDCGGWADGHDAIAERLISALEASDVLLVVDSPGGAHAGLEQAVARVLHEKEEHGRKITVFADEMIGSAAYWWAACVGDEIFAPASGVVGSIGARSAHASEAGALLQHGIEVTHFCWPGAGKVAFASELPLSDLGRQRGERDTAIAGEAFAAAVGPRRGMTREEIVELDADALSGDAAIAAKLIDGVASYEDVLEYCLTMANASPKGESEMASTDTAARAASLATAHVSHAGTIVTHAALRTEDEKPKGEDGGEEPAGKEPDAICKSCGHQQEMDAKYCDQCGDSMEAPPLEDPDADDNGEKNEPAKETRSPSATFASLLGLRPGASDLAVKTAIIRKLSVTDFVATLTGTTDENTQLGQLRAMSEDAKESGKLRRTTAELKARTEAGERLDLLKSLAAAGLPDYPRGNLLIDEVAENGRLVSTNPAPAYAEMKIGTLRGLVTAKLANASPNAPGLAANRSPFTPAEPDPIAAGAAVNTAKIESAKKLPAVIAAAHSGISLDTAAAIYVQNFGGSL